MKKLFLFLVCFSLLTAIVRAEEDLAPNSKSAILLEASTGEILYQKNAHEKLPPASMTKIMSLLIIMEAIETNKIKMDDMVVVSDNAAGMGGSQIFLQIGSKMKVFDLLKGVAVASANDAVVALAEKVAGSESKFVELMNDKAKELGLKNTNFKNSHGLDDTDHYSTAYDMAFIARELIKHDTILNFTKIYEEYLYKEDGTSIWLVNTNRLVRFYEGMDGLKTGFTSLSGYCLTATAKKENLRLISVVMKVETSDKRSSDTLKLLNYGFNGYKINLILKASADIGDIKIDNGKKETAKLALLTDVSELQKITDELKKYTFNVKTDKVKAPVKEGDIVGVLEIIQDKKVVRSVPLTVKEEVKKANLFGLMYRNFKYILSGKTLF